MFSYNMNDIKEKNRNRFTNSLNKILYFAMKYHNNEYKQIEIIENPLNLLKYNEYKIGYKIGQFFYLFLGYISSRLRQKYFIVTC